MSETHDEQVGKFADALDALDVTATLTDTREGYRKSASVDLDGFPLDGQPFTPDVEWPDA